MAVAYPLPTPVFHHPLGRPLRLTEAQLYAGRAIDRDWYLDRLMVVTKPEMAKGYQLRMERHTQSYVKGLEVKIK